ncbi:MAG: HAD family phosphatase [Candidatus Lokiarchaeota archaeon]
MIFDMDGVLADTSSAHFKSWKMIAKKLGVDFSKQFFSKTFGQRNDSTIRKLVKGNISSDKIEYWGKLKEKYYRDLIKDEIEPLPGVISLIKSLKNHKFKLAVGSSGPKENVDLLLDSLKIKDFFDIIVTAEDVKEGKPNPEVFLTVSKNIQIRPEKCIVIEDAPVGIEASKRAKMKTIALTSTHNKLELKGADLILNSLENLNVENIKNLFQNFQKS